MVYSLSLSIYLFVIYHSKCYSFISVMVEVVSHVHTALSVDNICDGDESVALLGALFTVSDMMG